MGRRRYRYGQSADIDDPRRQGMRLGFYIAGLPVFGTPGNDAAMSSVVIMAPSGADMLFVMVTMMRMRLAIVVPVLAVPLFIVFATAAAPPVGHGRSAEKHQNHC